jgi:hypothetical protein
MRVALETNRTRACWFTPLYEPAKSNLGFTYLGPLPGQALRPASASPDGLILIVVGRALCQPLTDAPHKRTRATSGPIQG